MALTDDEKTIRKKVVGRAVRLLRDHLQLKQPQFARLLDEEADVMAVSRWERGVALPHPRTRKNLAEIARKNGRGDLEGAFRDPVANWKTALPGNAKLVTNLIAVLEICAINEHIAGLDNGEDKRYYHALEALAVQVTDRIVRRARETGVMPMLVTDTQRHYWFGLMEDLGITGQKKRHGKREKNEPGQETR